MKHWKTCAVINAQTVTYAVIGCPVRHSLSPLLQNWLIKNFDLNAVYVAFEVLPERLSACVNGMRAGGMKGLNVTIPHKENVLQHLDSRSPEVAKLGAANTLKLIDGQVHGFVTDPQGFLESLGGDKNYFKDSAITLIGAGGAARSIAFALGTLGIRQLIIANRTVERARQLAALAQGSFAVPLCRATALFSPETDDMIATSDIIINASSLGMHPNVDLSPVTSASPFHSAQLVYDLVYNPLETKLLRLARSKGATVRNGLDMLIFQGLESQRIWNDQHFHLSNKQKKSLTNLLYSELE